ncbi:KilA-N domain-containing protein [Roseixanthobacter glucoisosaccharinicivorans]|uniref:KilA-N domain-containing protein n=1 Tax=Roseixanthobacter glucoisosaccharinicivorans TaxID=3119923 RepID=UPI00372B6BE7
MTAQDMARSPLSFNGVEIRDRSEMLSLTDMWKAAGSPEHKRPAEWARKEGAEFIAFLADAHNVAHSHIIKGERGRSGATFAHWQIALAYAKALSPEFHMQCNVVIRERMEGKATAAIVTGETADEISRALGIMKSTIHKVTEMERAVKRLEAMRAAPTFDLSGSVTSDTIIELAGVNRKERVRGTTVMITNAMLDFCDGSGCFRTPADLNPARPWRFPREKARDWLFGTDHGAERIRNQIGAQMRKKDKKGQRLLNLVPPPSQPPAG